MRALAALLPFTIQGFLEPADRRADARLGAFRFLAPPVPEELLRVLEVRERDRDVPTARNTVLISAFTAGVC